MLIEVYADVVCPWCAIGERRLSAALAMLGDLDIQRSWRPFQLRPEMPERGLPWAPFIAEKFGGEGGARAAFAQVTAAGAADGLSFRFDRVASAPNTVDAHRLILWAAGRGREWETADALFEAYFTLGRNLNDPDHLAEAAAKAGLDSGEVCAHLAGDGGRAEVAESQQVAARLGIQSVPTYVIDGRYALSGAQPAEVLAAAIREIAAERPALVSGRGASKA